LTNVYTAIGQVESMEHNGNNIAYDFIDDMATGDDYYRLRVIDLDGQESLTPVVHITNVKSQNNALVIPNPAKTNIQLLVNANRFAGEMNLTVFDAIGRVVQSKLVQVQNGLNSITLDISELSNGNYIIQYNSDSDALTGRVKFTKTN